jgi:tetratricopeptide (TPR) repeat protein
MFRGRYTEASAHLAEAIRLTRMQQAQTSEVRNRLLMAGALAQRGLIDGATEQLDSAYALVGRVDADPVLLFWLGKALVRAGDVRRAELLAEALDAKRHPDNRSARAASEALHAEVLVGRGRPADALFHLETALQLDSTKVTLESLSRAVAETGDLGRAARLYKELAEAPAFGWEGQEPWRLAQYWQAEIAERQGNVDKALQFYEQFLEAWQEAELSLPILREARDRLVRLRHQIEQNAR